MKFINPVFTVESEDYTGQVTALELTPEVEQTVTKTLKPTRNIVDTDSATWKLRLTMEQGSELHELFLATAPGAELDCVMQVEPGVGKRKATFTISSMPTTFGGNRGDVLFAELEVAVIDQPVWSVSA